MTETETKLTGADIAKDVIKLLDAGLLKPHTGWFLNEGTFGDRTIKEHLALEDADSPCEVCGLGAFFIAAVCRGEEDITPYAEVGYTSKEGVYNLRPYFTGEEMDTIELYFEGWRAHLRPNPEHACIFRAHYPSNETRLRLICENIIANDGHFVPEKLT